jgi:peptide/nickel transport system permease protein
VPALLRRLGAAAALLWLVVTLTFLLVRAAPGDPAALLLPPTAHAADEARLRATLGLDRPLAVQYGRWLGATLRGDLGTSFAQGAGGRGAGDAIPRRWRWDGVAALSYLLASPSARCRRCCARAVTGAVARPTRRSRWRRRRSTRRRASGSRSGLIALFTAGASRWGFPAAPRLPAFGMADPAGAS